MLSKIVKRWDFVEQTIITSFFKISYFRSVKYFFFIIVLCFFFSCSKEKEDPAPILVPQPEQYERFIGDYKVYDTLGSFIYDMSIVHVFSGNNIYQNLVDSVVIENFADTFDIRYEFRRKIDKNDFDFGFHDSIVDGNNKSWGLWSMSDDTSTEVKENYLFNDTIVMYFEQDNIKYYIPEAQPYFRCECKHVAVKQ